MVLPSNIDALHLSLNEAIGNASWSKRVDHDVRTLTLTLPNAIRGQYVRIQRDDDEYLAISEIEVRCKASRIVGDHIRPDLVPLR